MCLFLDICQGFFGSNFTSLKHVELPILRLFKKKIIFVFHGSDSRPPYLDGALMNEESSIDIHQCIELAAKKKSEIKKIEKYADVLIIYPTQGHFHERSFILSPYLGLPFELTGNLPLQQPEKKNLMILHAPSNPVAKGTPLIRKRSCESQKKGLSV